MASYDNVGNVNGYSDSTDAGTASIMGTWAFQYDALNRLVTGTSGATTGPYANMKLCWSYDRGPHGQVFVRGVEDRGPHGQVFVRGVEDDFGNRIIENVQTGACSTAGSVASTLVFNAGVPADRSSSVGWNAQNQLTGVIPPGGGSQSPSTLLYDSAGDVTSDSHTGNQYVYDAEGRICAFQTPNGLGGTIMMGYLYDAEGTRVAKGTITTMSCDPATNGFTMTGNNTGTYVLGLGGEELTQLSGSGAWQRTNVFGGGKQLATYDSMGLHFQIEDALGTRRMQTNADGQPETDIQSLPYGDALATANDQYAPATADDATPLHFTGKERDTESGNDYFGARYYASSMGRFLIPDWSAKAEPVPYAKLDNPQSLNLYAYVLNNPLGVVDLDGHAVDCSGDNASKIGCKYNSDWLKQHGENNSDNGEADSQASGGQQQNGGQTQQSAQQSSGSSPSSSLSRGDKIEGEQRAAMLKTLTGKLCTSGDAGCSGDIDQRLVVAPQIGVNGLKGGNWNFELLGENGQPEMIQTSGCLSGRCGLFPSLHVHEDGTMHLDTMNSYSLMGAGAIVHLIVDVIGGNTWWSGGIPR